jgi:hypothetical protein
VRKVMENQVTMLLKDYDSLKDKVKEYEKKAIDSTLELMTLKIFKIQKACTGELTIELSDDAKRYLDKAFYDFRDEYEMKPLEKLYIWGCATKKSAIKEEPKEVF